MRPNPTPSAGGEPLPASTAAALALAAEGGLWDAIGSWRGGVTVDFAGEQFAVRQRPP
jgi:hypothetical protein